MVPNHAICVCVREGKTCKQNREGYKYTERERERERRDKERLGDRERERVPEYT